MNKQRRAEILTIRNRLSVLLTECENLSAADEIASDIEGIASDEREYYENLPENMQGGEKGEAASAAAEQLESAQNSVEEFDTMRAELIDKLNEAIASLEEATAT